MWLKEIDSQAEDWFYHELQKRTRAEIKAQVKAPVLGKTYRLDFVITHNGESVGFEIDGKEYHDTERDSCRDRDILKHHDWLDYIVRFEAHDLVYNSYFATLFICKNFPELIVGPKKSDKHSRTPSEIEADKTLVNNSERVWDQLKGGMHVQGVYDITKVGVSDKHGYEAHHFNISFMSADKEAEYFSLQERNYENAYTINALDFTSTKSTTVLIMKRYV